MRFVLAPVAGASHRDAHVLRDFLHFYTQGLIARLHDSHALGDMEAMAAVARTALPEAATQMYPPVYGPQVALLFLPFAHVSYVSGLYVWLALTIAVTCWCVVATWRSCSNRDSQRGSCPCCCLASRTAFHPVVRTGIHRRFTCAHVVVAELRDGRMVLAGVAVICSHTWPQLGIVLAAVFVGRGEWRVVTGRCYRSWRREQQLPSTGTAHFLGYANALSRLPRLFSAMGAGRRARASPCAQSTGFISRRRPP